MSPVSEQNGITVIDRVCILHSDYVGEIHKDCKRDCLVQINSSSDSYRIIVTLFPVQRVIKAIMFYNRVYAIDADVKDFRVVVKGSVERDYDFVLLDYFVLLHFYLRVQTERGGVTVRIITVTNDKILV